MRLCEERKSPMRIYSIFLCGICLLCSVFRTRGQSPVHYYADTTVRVFTGSVEKRIAFSGGFNNPQFAVADLNKDGLRDLVVYERGAAVVKTFINFGVAGTPDYRYRPAYAANFPAVYHFLKLEDYNCDNVPDLIQRGYFGFSIWRGYYDANNRLAFTFFKDLYYQYNNGWINAYSEPSDVPVVADVDKDGDLDFLAYFIGGGQIYWYQNMRVEDGLPCDSVRIKIGDACWGKVLQGFQRSQTLGYSCVTSNKAVDDDNDPMAKTTLHTGNTLCLADIDGDGDYDYFNGNVSFPDVQFFKNGRQDLLYPRDSIIAEDTLWGANGQDLHLVQWPATFWLDIDADNDRDLVFSPNAENASENYKTIVWYQNIGSDANPNFTYIKDTLLVEDAIDMGAAAYPALYDYNKDGKLDLFVGADGFFQTNGTLRAKIAYYQNVSTPGNPSFSLQSLNFANIDSLNIYGAAPAFGDLDNDGLDDMVVGHRDGSISFYKNVAANAAAQPQWQLSQVTLADVNGHAIDSGTAAAPFIYDLNADGLKDLIVGVQTGWIYYYKNLGGQPGLVKLQHQTSKLGLVKSDPFNVVSAYCTPFIGKVDLSGNDYLLCGANSGILYRYSGFQGGNTTAPFQRVDSGYSQINMMLSPYSGFRSAPTVGDIDGDSTLEMIVGTIHGGVQVYRHDGTTAVSSLGTVASSREAMVSPNPFEHSTEVRWDAGFAGAEQEVSVEIMDMSGRLLRRQVGRGIARKMEINAEGLPSGLLLFRVTGGQSVMVYKVIKR